MTKLLEYKTRRFVKQNRDDMDIETTHKLSRTALAYLLNLRHHGWTRDKPCNIGQQNIISVIYLSTLYISTQIYTIKNLHRKSKDKNLFFIFLCFILYCPIFETHLYHINSGISLKAIKYSRR